MPIEQLSEREALTVELALIIEDPASIEAIDLAATILEVFERRNPPQANLMRESLYRWAQQWPRNVQATNGPIVKA